MNQVPTQYVNLLGLQSLWQAKAIVITICVKSIAGSLERNMEKYAGGEV